MNTETPTPPAVVLSTALLERIDDLAEWFTDNPNHSDIKDGLTVLARDVAYAERERCIPEVDELAQQIRWLNGSNKRGAGSLAEELVEWLRSRA